MKLLFKQDIRKATNLDNPQSIIAYFNGFKDGKPTKIQYKTDYKVLAKHFSNGRVVNSYSKHEINPSLSKAEAFFYDEAQKERQNGLEPDKATLIRAIRKSQGLSEEVPQIIYLTQWSQIFLGKTKTIVNPKGQLGLSKDTVQNYSQLNDALQRYEATRVKEGFKRITLQYATQDELSTFRSYLLEVEKLASSTTQTRIKDLKALAGYAKNNGMTVSSAFVDFKNTRQKAKNREEIIYLTDQEVDAILSYDGPLTDKLDNVKRLFTIQAVTGIRVSDLMKLKTNSFKVDDEGDYILHLETKKGVKPLQLPVIDRRAVKVIETGLFKDISEQKYNLYLKELGKVCGVDKEIWGNKKMKTYIMDDENGDPIHKQRLQRIKLPKYHFLKAHSSRYTALTNLFNTGVPTQIILQISTHSTEAMLFKYLGVDPDRGRQAQEMKKYLKR